MAVRRREVLDYLKSSHWVLRSASPRVHRHCSGHTYPEQPEAENTHTLVPIPCPVSSGKAVVLLPAACYMVPDVLMTYGRGDPHSDDRSEEKPFVARSANERRGRSPVTP